MKLALNGATTMKADLRTDILAAQAAGFDYVEIWAAKLRNYLVNESGSVADLRRLFEGSAVEPLSINSIEHITFRSETDYAKIKSECEELSSIAAALECPYVVVVPGKLPANAPTREEVIAESVRVLSELAEIAGNHGVSLAFEFLGQTDCSVQTLDLANEIVTRVARPNIGLVIDSFHFYAGGSTIEMIETLDPERLFIFHINDAEDLPREQLQDSHRLLPGLGILPLPEILRAFSRIGYDRVASVEIFRPEYWERDPFELARDAKSALKTVLGET
jgi:2-keto-myo-inositol isomerase